MSHIIENWLNSGKFAEIEGIQLVPKVNQLLKGTPLYIVCGQATIFYLKSNDNKNWVLKKFLPGRIPNTVYISSIQALIPHISGFECGYHRKVLKKDSLLSSKYFTSDLSKWLENTILMRQIGGYEWAKIADDIRSGKTELKKEQRIKLCISLIDLIKNLEAQNISHRDLSSRNIIIDINTRKVNLIDWDSVFHPSLKIPSNTTFGTDGYIAPFIKQDSKKTWKEFSDRFSLAVLIMEFLSIKQGSSFTGDGGIFDQSEIDNKGGPGISNILSSLDNSFSTSKTLFSIALNATTFQSMPSPEDWERELSSVYKSIFSPIASEQKLPLGLHPPRLLYKTISFILLIGIIGFILSALFIAPFGIDPGRKEFVEIKRGMTLTDISQILKEHNLINDAERFVQIGNLLGYEKKLRYGKYILISGASHYELLSILAEGREEYKKVTIPEGASIGQIITIFKKENLNFKEGDFHNLVTNQKLINALGLNDFKTVSLDGFLCPETYHLANNFTTEDILKILVKEFLRKWMILIK